MVKIRYFLTYGEIALGIIQNGPKMYYKGLQIQC